VPEVRRVATLDDTGSGTSFLVPFGAPPTTSERIRLKENALATGYSRRF
jgi:hypothetical protein